MTTETRKEGEEWVGMSVVEAVAADGRRPTLRERRRAQICADR